MGTTLPDEPGATSPTAGPSGGGGVAECDASGSNESGPAGGVMLGAGGDALGKALTAVRGPAGNDELGRTSGSGTRRVGGVELGEMSTPTGLVTSMTSVREIQRRGTM